MTSTTLTRTGTVRLNANGDGTITLRPDMGQNWAPLFVRISTASSATPVAYCAVYHGSPGVPVQASQFIDDTFSGNGDASSIIAGTPVLFGEGIIFSFQGGTPGDTATASVYGMQSDLPPNLDLNPQVPGTHFSGHLNTEVVTDIDASIAGVTLDTLGFTVFTTAVFDVRQFGSYYLEIDAVTTSNPATGFNPTQVTLNWFTDANQTVLMHQDTYEFWADNQTGANIIFSLGSVFLQDVMHGPYMQMVFRNNALNDSVKVTWVLKGTTRTLSLSVRQQDLGGFTGNGIDGILIDTTSNLIAGARSLPLVLTYGQTAMVFINNPGANPMSVFMCFGTIGSFGPTRDQDFIAQVNAVSAIGRPTPVQLIFPKRAGLLKVFGTGTDQFAVRVITQFNKN